MKKNLALIAGGYTGEYKISIGTAHTIAHNLDNSLYNIYTIIIDKEKWVYTHSDGQEIKIDKNDFSILVDDQKIRFDIAFIAVHGTPGEDGKLQGYLEMMEIPFTSCGAIVSGITFNKIYCNAIVAQSGLVHVSKSLHLHHSRCLSTEEILEKISLPAFVKPAEGGSSLATTKVKTKEDIRPALEAVFDFEPQAMIEEFVHGREFSIGVYRSQGQVYALPITEIISSKEFFDYEAKYTPGVSQEVTPAQLDNEQTQSIRETAKNIYDLLNAKGICRIDFILEHGSQALYFLEINTVPGQSENSIVPQQVKAIGMSLKDFYNILIQETLKG
ncbi:MAG: D-alanine--D-alanine ligase [Chitinophagaceae bacterium]